MNINQFKEGNIITRNEPGGYSKTDSSYCGDRLILRGHDPVSKIIFLQHTDLPFEDDIIQLSYARDTWDEGWCLYPEHIWQKVVSFLKSKNKKCPECGSTNCKEPLHWE